MLHILLRPFVLVLICVMTSTAGAATLDIGPSQAYTRIGAISWNSLMPGDVVRIHGQTSHYKEMLVIASSGTAASHITLQGCPGPAASRSSSMAMAATDAQFSWVSTAYIQGLGAAIVYQAAYVDISGIAFTGASSSNGFTDSSGAVASFGAGRLVCTSSEAIRPYRGERLQHLRQWQRPVRQFQQSYQQQYPHPGLPRVGKWRVGSYYEHNWYTPRAWA